MGKVRILVLDPGGLPGKTSGDIVENPTDEEIAHAKKNLTCLRLLGVDAAGDGETGEVGKNATYTGKADRNRGDLGRNE
jgi:hypothetical protein